MGHSEICISGLGIISAIGNSVAETRSSLLSGRSFLKPLSGFNSRFEGVAHVGQIPLTDDQLLQQLKTQYDAPVSRSVLLAQHAVEEALSYNGLEDYCKTMALITASTVAGISNTEQYFKAITEGRYIPNQAFVDEMDCGAITRKLARTNGFGGELCSISTACSSASNAILLGARLIKSGKAKIVICGGTDALSRFTINGFNSLKNMSMAPCKPFDANRTGLNLGEGAAFIVLELTEHAIKRGARPLAYYSGGANRNESYHLTGSSPDGSGPYLAMQGALSEAELKPEDIDYVLAHGTSTLDNDLAEGMAIARLFPTDIAFSSNKALIGHTLAASGAISSVQAVVALQESKVFPNLNFEEPMPEHGLLPITSVHNKTVHHTMVNAFGFGGSNTSLIFSGI